MFASPASHLPHQNPIAAAANGQQQQQQQHAQPLPPPSLREILDAFGKDGNGDREMLMSILSSKRAEEERIASQLNYQTQLFLLAQQYQALQAHALVAQQQQQQQRIGQTSFGTPSPVPSSHQPLPSPSPSHYSECSASSSSSSFSGAAARYSPYARSSSGADSLAPAFDGQQTHAFRSEKQARINSAAKARRARGSSSASSSSAPTPSTTAHGTVVAPLASPAQSATSIPRDTSMSPPPLPSPTAGASHSTAPKRAALSDLLGATTAAYAVSVRETAVQESFIRGGDDASSE